MNRISTKSAAEAALRELPSVRGAYVSEDLEGRPREIHLLIGEGPDPASLARDVRGLLEERLGIPIDQRVISIAQLASNGDDALPSQSAEAPTPEPEPAAKAVAAPLESRPIFGGIEATTASGHVTVGVRLECEGRVSTGTAEAVDTQAGRARAAATATLRSAAEAPWNEDLNLELDFASIVQALEGEYVLVSVLAVSHRLGRRPLSLVGAHPVDRDVESAAALAALKAINRVLSAALKHD